MNVNVWLETGGDHLRNTLIQEARKWHLFHQPPATLPAWQQYRRELRRKLKAFAGTFPQPVPLNIREQGTVRQEGYRIIKLTYQSRPELRVTANLYVPDGDGPFPGVLNLHGHRNQGKIAHQVQARGHTLAKEGFAVLTVDAFGSGERGTVPGQFEYHGSQIGSSLLPLGETLLGMQVYDNMRGIDLLQSLDYVNGSRIGVTGASGGGNQTMWLTAFDERVKAAVPVVSVGTFESYVTHCNCICETFPQGLTFMEEWAVLALAAPNALLILNSLQDTATFNVQEMSRSFNAAREIYRLHGAIEKIAYNAINLPHSYWPEMRRHMLGWFKRWLKDEGAGWPCEIPTVPELPEAKLMCFPGRSRPDNVKSILEYSTLIGHRQKRQFMAGSSSLHATAKRRELDHLVKIAPGSTYVGIGPVVRSVEDGYTCERFTVESEPGVLLPCVRLIPKQMTAAQQCANPTVIALHPEGKQTLIGKECIRDLIERRYTVCLTDLRHTGETTWNPPDICEHHDAARSALWLGRTMLGDWAKDLLALRAALSDSTGAKNMELLAFGPPALAALIAAALTSDFKRITVSNLLASYVLNGKAPALGMSVFVPGILRWGDVSLLAALAKCPVIVHAPVHLTGKKLTARELLAWSGEIKTLAKRLSVRGRIEVRPQEL